MRARHCVIVGAGIGGLAAALDLAAQGFEVTVLERGQTVGGKLREVEVGGVPIDAGPTVFTMRWVFETLFASAGFDFSAELSSERATVLARHAWRDGSVLDLHADVCDSADAIGRFAGGPARRAFLDFAARAKAVYRTLEGPFIRSRCESPLALIRALGLRRLGELVRIAPFETLWRALGRYFEDPRLRQLFGRYATYCGSSPFLSPATLMLVAHVEQDGVWLLRDGMHSLARAVARAAERRGAQVRLGAHVAAIDIERGSARGVTLDSGERIGADAIILNADSAALAAGCFGERAARAMPRRVPARSLSAITWLLRAQVEGFALQRHNVFFSNDSRAEFDDLFRRTRVPLEPTVYVCAQDRDGTTGARSQPERFLCLINAPANGDTHSYDDAETRACHRRTFDLLQQCGLTLRHSPERTMAATPNDFHRLYPATGGALYGPASHGWRASFNRVGSRSPIPGLYFAGGSTHPGPGVPMAALSGRLAAQALIEDSVSTATSRRPDTHGGMSTASATTASTRSR